MDELGAELDRRADARQPPCPATAADAPARFEDQYLPAGARELRSGGKAGGAGADDDNLVIQL
jgi:hypothetical protein